jgi:hypothetical protein
MFKITTLDNYNTHLPRALQRTKFTTYEKARQAVRKLIRETNLPSSDLFWTSNPMIGDYGFSIKKV